MLDGKGRLRITDFGLAGFAEQIKGSEVMVGTPAYLSPEQFAGKEVTTAPPTLSSTIYPNVYSGYRGFADSLGYLHGD